MLKRLPPFLLFVVFFSGFYSQAQIIYSSQDGNWEDSSSWVNHQPPGDSISNDTITIAHHINFNTDLFLSNCYLKIDTFASLCGHDSVHLYYSQLYEYGGFYAEHVLVESSQWLCYHGYWVVTTSVLYTGVGSAGLVCCGCGGHVGGGFICTIPVQSWNDTTQTDTSQTDSTIIPPPKPPPSISVYPNPSFDHFIIDSEVPDSNSNVTLNIYDLLGRKMKTLSIPDGKSSLTIFTNNWAAGMYLLRFEQGETLIQTDRIVRVQ